MKYVLISAQTIPYDFDHYDLFDNENYLP